VRACSETSADFRGRQGSRGRAHHIDAATVGNDVHGGKPRGHSLHGALKGEGVEEEGSNGGDFTLYVLGPLLHGFLGHCCVHRYAT
jgi:hypothetical protein